MRFEWNFIMLVPYFKRNYFTMELDTYIRYGRQHHINVTMNSCIRYMNDV